VSYSFGDDGQGGDDGVHQYKSPQVPQAVWGAMAGCGANAACTTHHGTLVGGAKTQQTTQPNQVAGVAAAWQS